MSLSLVSGNSAFLHDGYIAAIENCCVLTAVKRTLFPTHIASLLLGASFNMIFAMCLTSLLLGALFNTKLLLQNFILERYSYNTIKCLKPHNVIGTHMCKSKKHAWHQTTRVATRLWNKCTYTTHTHLSIQRICHETILLTTRSASSFIIYACRTILVGIITNILGHQRYTVFVALVAIARCVCSSHI